MTALPAPSSLPTPDGGDPAVGFETGARALGIGDTADSPWPDVAPTGGSGAGPAEAEATIPWDLDDATTRQLRRWSNGLYRLLDSDAPPFGTLDDYDRITAELERREEQARLGPVRPGRRLSFRDNSLNRRFEAFQDGTLAGYVSYSLRAGSLRLHRTVVAAGFEGTGLEQVLIRRVLLDAHRRRLAALPYCGEVQAFLAGHPQYRALLVR